MDEPVPRGIRRAEGPDLDWLIQQMGGSSWPPAVSELPWHAWIGSDHHFVYMLEQETLLGVLVISRSDRLAPDRVAVELLTWFIAPGSRGQYLGRKLLVHGISGARRLEGDELVCWLPISQHAAEAVLRRNGFEPRMERHDFSGAVATVERGWVLDISAYF